MNAYEEGLAKGRAEGVAALLAMSKRSGQTGWVLVKYVNPGRVIHYLYVPLTGDFQWTTDSLKALRLARREDGDALARVIEDADAVEEHGWVDSSDQVGEKREP